MRTFKGNKRDLIIWYVALISKDKHLTILFYKKF